VLPAPISRRRKFLADTGQRDVITEDPLSKTNFDGALQFSTPWRYTQNNLDIACRIRSRLASRATSPMYLRLGSSALPRTAHAAISSAACGLHLLRPCRLDNVSPASIAQLPRIGQAAIPACVG